MWCRQHVSYKIIITVITESVMLFAPSLSTCLLLQGRALSRAKSRRNLDFQDVLDKLADQGIAIRVASPKLVMEEVRKCSQISAFNLYKLFY